MQKRIAVIGAGISGLTCANLLSRRFEVSLFEANNYLGGHTNTLTVPIGQTDYAIDTGFIVFNKKTYPNFCQLLNRHQIAYQPTEMSFSYRDTQGQFEYNGNNLNTLFADRQNIVSPNFYGFLKDILRFNRLAKQFIQTAGIDTTIAQFLEVHHFNRRFVTTYLVPVIAAVWSKNPADVLACSAKFIFEFLANHGLLQVLNRPQWYVITGGSKTYIEPLIGPFQQRIFLATPVTKIFRKAIGVILQTRDQQFSFDEVVIATHSDQALAMLGDPSRAEQQILSAIQYIPNKAILHTDTSVLPTHQLAWASWNYYDKGIDQVALTYYMNRLQNIKAPVDFCLSVNLEDKIEPKKILASIPYAHPRFTTTALKAQHEWATINGQNRTYFCGAYWGYGFHEDGVNSALRIANLHKVGLCN